MGSWNFFSGKKVQNIKSESKSSGQLGEFFMVWIFPFFYAQVSQGISSYYQSHMILPSTHWLLWLWINTFFHRGLIWIWIKVQKSDTAIVLSLIFSLIFKSLSVLRVFRAKYQIKIFWAMGTIDSSWFEFCDLLIIFPTINNLAWWFVFGNETIDIFSVKKNV